MKTTARSFANIRLTVALLGILLVAFPHQSQAQQQKQSGGFSPEELFKRLSRSIFVVEVLDENGSMVALGSGVAVTPNQIVTNKHVVEDGAAFRIKQGNKTWPVATIDPDSDHDLCR